MEILTDVSAERALIAGVFKGGADAYFDVADIIQPVTFTLDSNQCLWKCIEHVCQDHSVNHIDYPTIRSAANSLGFGEFLDKPAEAEHLRSIMNMPLRVENTRKFAGKLRKLQIARLYLDANDESRKNIMDITGDETLDSIITRAEGPMIDLSSLLQNNGDVGIRAMGEGAEEYLEHLMDNPRSLMGISTGLRKFDLAIGGGMRPGSCTVIAARPKTGKTFLVDKVCTHVAGVEGLPVLNIDTEMSWEEHLHRVAANLVGLPITDIERGVCGVNPQNRQKIREAARRLKDMPYDYLSICGQAFEETLASMRRWVIKKVGLGPDGKANPCVIVFDYLKLMDASSIKGNIAEHQALGFVTTALKNFMGRYGVPLLTFAQLSRDGIDKEDTSVISQSDRILWFCTSMNIYKRKDEDEIAEDRSRGKFYSHKLINIADRYGPGMKDNDYINIRARYEIAQIEEGATRIEVEKGLDRDEKKGMIVDDHSEQQPYQV